MIIMTYRRTGQENIRCVGTVHNAKSNDNINNVVRVCTFFTRYAHDGI